MTKSASVARKSLSRREFTAIACGAAALCFGAAPSRALGSGGAFEQTLARILGGAKPAAGPIKFEIPERAENGMMVAYTVSVASPMTEADRVVRLHLLSSANVKPVLSVFLFTSASGAANVSGRIRLAKTQKVVAVAELSGGRFLVAEKTVEVTVGSCG